MATVNNVMLIGYLGRDPEYKSNSKGLAIAGLTVATSTYSKDDEGNKVENTEWHRVVAFDKAADFALKYLKKGALVLVKGRLKTRSYDKDGEKRYVTEVIAEQLQSLDRKPESEKTDSRSEAMNKALNKNKKSKRDSDVPDDDIPF